MKEKRVGTWFLVVAACCLAGGWVVAQGDPSATDMDAQMAEMMKYATPNEHHEHLARLVGKWKSEGKLWMQPGAPPTLTSGTTENTMILGGRFLLSELTADFMGRPMSGFGLDGYDVYADKHVGIWTDSMGTMIMTLEGECSENGKTRTMISEFDDPMSGQRMKMKMKITHESDDRHVMEGWFLGVGDEPFKCMEFVYTRL